MNKYTLSGAALVAMLATGPVQPAIAQGYGGGGGTTGTYSGDTQYGSPHQMPEKDFRPSSFDAASKAEDLRLKGKCDEAIPLLRGIIDNGGASDISQYNLGLCLLDVAEKDTAHAAELKKEGTHWIVAAANGGLARAQARAVSLLLDGVGTAPDPVGAKTMALLYKGNPSRYNFGLPDLPDDLNTRLDAALTGPQRIEARKRANAWTPPSLQE
ncbi:MAG TPA: hypothetical protein VHE09_08185 [Rhizomicrobium sp.]|jgi:hypothetical protein|nr:hypothetical protein [Rhizomicrobium sp.]